MYAGKSIDKAFEEQGHADSAYYVMQQLPIEGRVVDQKSDTAKIDEVK